MEVEPTAIDSPDENEEESEVNPYVSEDDDEPSGREAEAQEVPAPAAEEEPKVKPKRVIKNPQPKLDTVRLMGPRGVGVLQSSFKDMKFRGKGHEKEDLTMLMKKLEHWAHRLFPKLPFDDTLKQIEKLGMKKPVQNMVKRIRLDMFQSDEMNEPEASVNSQAESNKVAEVDVFDELLGTGPFADNSSVVPDTPSDTITSISDSQTSKVTTLTAEQRERMEKNRLLALERRRARLLKRQNEETSQIGNCSVTDIESIPMSQNIFTPISDALPITLNQINSEDSSSEVPFIHDVSKTECANPHESESRISEETVEIATDDKSKPNNLINEELGSKTMEVDPFNDVQRPGLSAHCERGSREDLSTMNDKTKMEGENRGKVGESSDSHNCIFTEDDILNFVDNEKAKS